ncbi:MAG: signal recognition particle protein [Planctomycetota bacterium]|nr:MAG: signal recognition particle protein [Planctomycetota bacterium]
MGAAGRTDREPPTTSRSGPVFEAITESMTSALDKLRGRRLTEANIDEALRDVKKALLAADVNVRVVKQFLDDVKRRAVGQKLLDGIAPGQQVVKVVHDALVELMGGQTDATIRRNPKSGQPTIIMMCGLQGSGKTTSCGKLARMLKHKGHRPLLVAADLQRPAAIEQLRTLGEQVGVPVYAEEPGWRRGKPVKVCQRAVKQAEREQHDFVILDTAGRLHIDRELMDELGAIRSKLSPHNVFLVIDAMTGQDAVASAREFNEQLPLDGVILTKLDGDARGGAALSVRAVTGKPIKFIGTGEKLDKLEPFHPDRMAGRILGMGDVVTLVEKAQQVISQEDAEDAAVKLLSGAGFTFDDFLKQMQSIKKLGPIRNWLGMIPGLGAALKDMPIDDGEITAIEAMIQSMTRAERRNPDIINHSRRMRIARGSGHSAHEVASLIKQFKQVQKVMKDMGKSAGFRSMFGRGRKELQEKIAQSAQAARRKRRKPF